MADKKLLTRVPAVVLLCFILSFSGCRNAAAQQFTVKKFATLSNDISAFVNPVHDLNGEACAVIKIAAPEEFAFSTPLGIVKRKDEVGEIWLYLPKGSKKITIKHPLWGVLRDYKFPKPLESRLTYEMIIETPVMVQQVRHDTIVLTKTITDTITVKKQRPKLPLSSFALLTMSIHDNGPSLGIMLALMRRNGAYIHAQTDFRSTGNTVMTCSKDGSISGSDIKPYYTGKTRHSNYAITAGLIHRAGRVASIFYGAGYGRSATTWQLAESEGGGYALNDGLTHKGIAAEVGTVLTFGRLSFSASVLTVVCKQWQGTIGAGIKISKK